ncbi:protein kinase [Mycolicibacterium aurum]|uniref:non-specific serine/threonine protein kinase n=1 Tax=Mycolicibacterium aurum TaxID=1791 RepID=A0A3S4TEH9_MYCAU|nr:serine/threonine-protein kinase [Mycolicibacterium aurum]VEG57410.1 protein kinase [Mycolicibacterium aurum]
MTDPQQGSRVGSQVGPYQLRRLLGKGGMGEVYEAYDTVKDRVVALKLLPDGVSHDPVFRKRLQREAHAAGRLQEPHVVPIHDYGEVDGLLFVDMRMIDGTDLRKVLKEQGAMSPARATAIVAQIASALDAAHRAGITHRDVKPENILLTRDDFAYLVDFGIANAVTDEALTELGTAVGTYSYMAPERFTNGEVTHRADVYALTCVLHECLTGSQPFQGDSVSVVITAHLNQPAPTPSRMRPGIPAGLDDVVARGMAKRPEDRFDSAGEMARAATAALTSTDQDQAASILQRGQDATMMAPLPPPPPPPGYGATPPPPSPAYGGTPAYAGSYPPPPPPGAPPPGWAATPPPPSGGSKGPMILILGAAAVIVLALVAVGIWLVVKPGDSTSGPVASSPTSSAAETTPSREPTRRTRTSTAPPPPTESYDQQLMALLSAGHDSSNCQPVSPPAASALATVDCSQTTMPNGPAFTRYSLFGDQAALDAAFQEAIGVNSELLQCPASGIDSPTTWHYTETPDEVAGQIACGTYNDNPDVVWTNDGSLLLADAQGPSLDDLHNWWLEFG